LLVYLDCIQKNSNYLKAGLKAVFMFCESVLSIVAIKYRQFVLFLKHLGINKVALVEIAICSFYLG